MESHGSDEVCDTTTSPNWLGAIIGEMEVVKKSKTAMITAGFWLIRDGVACDINCIRTLGVLMAYGPTGH